MQLSFYPYYEAPQITPPNPGWELTVTAVGSDTDSFKIGASTIATEAYDFRIDLPKPPAKTLFPSTLIYLNRSDDPTFLDAQMQEEYQVISVGTLCKAECVNFSLDVADTNPVQLSIATLNIPAGWTVWFVLGWCSHARSPMAVCTPSIHLQQAPTMATSACYNQPVANTDLVQVPLSGLKAYPNPSIPPRLYLQHYHGAGCERRYLQPQGTEGLYHASGSRWSAGIHNLTWNARDDKGMQVASGIYFARVRTKARIQLSKCCSMK